MELTGTHKLILVDDHKMFLDGLLSILSGSNVFDIVLTADRGDKIAKYLDINQATDPVDLVITDISMPDYTGAELNRHIKKHHPKVKTLVVSMMHDADTIKTLTQENVDGYIPKNAEKDELLLAITTILKGDKYFSRSIKDTYFKSMLSNEEKVEDSLSKREKEVLKRIAQEFTTQEIADQLFLSKHTIESYRKNLISKLEVRNLAGLTKYAIKMGLLDDES
ncbi:MULTISPECIES: response regulator transcription factor [Flavobacteriaceae]|uniref:response regulator n=1 Tax=Flavobacteriaceae TaxID=49546 RepID=UPI0010ADB576|nr:MULTISPECIES: response regulator transcription factor [Flavobacteriaceae]NJB38026.1 response regulator transcription factor [Croceivirga sp. JEA036]TKD58961.1 response regulator transcription factor [Flavobacterium sp. ASW18X]